MKLTVLIPTHIKKVAEYFGVEKTSSYTSKIITQDWVKDWINNMDELFINKEKTEIILLYLQEGLNKRSDGLRGLKLWEVGHKYNVSNESSFCNPSFRVVEDDYIEDAPKDNAAFRALLNSIG